MRSPVTVAEMHTCSSNTVSRPLLRYRASMSSSTASATRGSWQIRETPQLPGLNASGNPLTSG